MNVTLGLPFVRTSPDHGTALSLAGTGRARPTSLIAALRWRTELAAARAARLSDTAALEALPPLREVIAAPRPFARERRSAEFPPRPQSDAPHRPRRRPARRCHIVEIGPGTGRAHPCAAARGRRAASPPSSATAAPPALAEIAAARPAGSRGRGRRARLRLSALAGGAAPHRREPSLQYLQRRCLSAGSRRSRGRPIGRASP